MRILSTKNLRFTAIIAALIACAALTGCSNGDSAPPSSTALPDMTTRAAPCKTGDLTTSVAGTDVKPDTRTVKIRVQNTSGTACSLTGSPDVEITSATGTVAGAKGSPEGRPAEVDPGGWAYFDMSFPTNGTQQCVEGERLVITPPGESSTLLLPFTLDEVPRICSDSRLTVTSLATQAM